MENDQKEVSFDQYCSTCQNKDADEHDDPCNECLANPSNTNSHKPVFYKKK